MTISPKSEKLKLGKGSVFVKSRLKSLPQERNRPPKVPRRDMPVTSTEEDTMIFRLSQKLNAKIKGGTLGTLPPHENPLLVWSAHLFVVDRVQYVLISNTHSLSSVVMFGRSITDQSDFIDRALSVIQGVHAVRRVRETYERCIVPAAETVCFAKTLDRSVTGSMAELIRHAFFWLTEGELSSHDVGVRLNDVLMSALGREGALPYGKPGEAFKALVTSSEMGEPQAGSRVSSSKAGSDR